MAQRAVRAAEADTIPVTEGSGNVFADLGFDDPEEELARVQLGVYIRQEVKRRRLTRAAAAALMEVDEPTLSALLDGRLGGFSSARLLSLLTALGQDVGIVVRPRQRGQERGRIRVVEAA